MALAQATVKSVRNARSATRYVPNLLGPIEGFLVPFWRGVFVVVMCWSLASTANAVIETYEFDNDELRERYNGFTDVLRCPKCQNQNLSGSNSPIAADLRRELHRLLQEGYSDAEIRDYMVARYGEFILYEPPLNRHTIVLWLFPLVLLAIGGLVLVAVVKRRGGQPAEAEQLAAVQDQAEILLQQHGRSSQTIATEQPTEQPSVMAASIAVASAPGAGLVDEKQSPGDKENG